MQEHNQGYLNGYIGQDRMELRSLLEEILEAGLLVPSSLLTEATELKLSEGSESFFDFEELLLVFP